MGGGKWLVLQFLLVVLTLYGVGGSRDSNLGPRERRQAPPPFQGRCASKFSHRSQHSACASRSPDVTSAGVSPSDVTQIVSEHNRYRGQVTPPAANMLKMSWDEELAMVAQRWAETCSLSHEPDHSRRDIPGRFNVGQNIGQGYGGWSDVIKAWYGESANFKYGDPGMDNPTGFVIGHYTQVVWATSSLVGCGFADCAGTKFYVCNYGPGGNVGGTSKPYTKGQAACESCPGKCESNLCDCGRVNCKNGGVYDVSKCQCNCSQTFYQGENCDLHCDGLEEPKDCGQAPFDEAGCKVYANAPSRCPNVCGICPYADIKFENSAAPGLAASSLVSAGLLLSLAAILGA